MIQICKSKFYTTFTFTFCFSLLFFIMGFTYFTHHWFIIVKDLKVIICTWRGCQLFPCFSLTTYAYNSFLHAQVSLLKYYSQFFLLLYRMHLSALVFHDDDPPSRLIVHYGCYMDEATLDTAFFEGSLGNDMSRSQMEEHVRFTNDFLRQLFSYLTRFRRLELREHELVMVMANIFWSSGELLLLSYERIKKLNFVKGQIWTF